MNYRNMKHISGFNEFASKRVWLLANMCLMYSYCVTAGRVYIEVVILLTKCITGICGYCTVLGVKLIRDS